MTVGSIVLCRMDSTRLPGKVLMNVGGKPLLWYAVTRIRQVENLEEKTIVATSSRRVDDPIESFCRDHNIKVFRGDYNNVALRLLECGVQNRFDWVMRANGDSPFVDPALVQLGCNIAESSNYEFVTNLYPRSFPYGVSLELISTRALQYAYTKITRQDHMEHPTLFFYENMDRFAYYNITRDGADLSNIHLTIDTEEELRRFREIADIVGEELVTLRYGDAVDLYHKVGTRR